MGFGLSDLGFEVWGLGFGGCGLEFVVRGAVLGVQVSGFGAWG